MGKESYFAPIAAIVKSYGTDYHIYLILTQLKIILILEREKILEWVCIKKSQISNQPIDAFLWVTRSLYHAVQVTKTF